MLIGRIFNTYGPWMCLDDGHIVSNFVSQVIRKQPMAIMVMDNKIEAFNTSPTW
ncbi:putative UDP-glucuronate decarboxylase [Helianthus annuus]|nr:putative UDP-glucuronate decarboxylase [Helianthus annuus]KAJ0611948.1 putative UDP-glucuronate decarboxylase [Helianthus annuus]KAJ0627318.1 putative UDP-glucuronate decarboxylase [Helianthus annuus]